MCEARNSHDTTYQQIQRRRRGGKGNGGEREGGSGVVDSGGVSERCGVGVSLRMTGRSRKLDTEVEGDVRCYADEMGFC